ncbi:MAG TPA: methyltransferase domain-containing protein [Chitinophagaceae bacterium]|nr:methyltransferase domain-containing protein [Chitinophagaceae bacterium]
MKEFWNSRYEESGTFYGEQPNSFFKEFIDRMPTGRLLLPGEGEGRNAIYAAANGWGVEAFDWSESARAAAAENAEIAGVMLHYELKDIADYRPVKRYDVIALIYVHLPAALRRQFHAKLVEALEPGGYVIMEAFSKNQVENIAAGPEDKALYYTAADIEKDFAGLDISLCDGEEIALAEGALHNRRANVIHFIGRKPY